MGENVAGAMSQQYEWVMQTRELLFEYCETISAADYIKQLESFGGGSIRGLLEHVAGSYLSWIGVFALKRQPTTIRTDSIQNVQGMRQAFMEVNRLVKDFLNEFDGQANVSNSPPWQEEHITVSPLWVFTRSITHEFHHKGQIVSMSRHLGYTPAITDLYHPSSPFM